MNPIISALAEGGSAPSKGAKDDHEYYPTPPEPTLALMRADPWFREPRRIWEPCCGEGHMAGVLAEAGHSVLGSDLVMRGDPSEDDGWSRHPTPTDYLRAPVLSAWPTKGGDLPPEGIVSNPPFSLAPAMIRKARREVGFLAMLLPATFWHAARASRSGPRLWDACRPSRLYALTFRPDFLGQGSPMVSLTWSVWDTAHRGACTFETLLKPDVETLFED